MLLGVGAALVTVGCELTDALGVGLALGRPANAKEAVIPMTITATSTAHGQGRRHHGLAALPIVPLPDGSAAMLLGDPVRPRR